MPCMASGMAQPGAFLLARTHGQTPVLTEHTGAVWLAFDAIGVQRLCPADAKAYDMLRKMSKYDG